MALMDGKIENQKGLLKSSNTAKQKNFTLWNIKKIKIKSRFGFATYEYTL